ncbi:CopG family transcriptional regulator [Burkholderia cepacia]|uniref:CopG family transcriptional regulator n=1 Tax=Burkholderia cepacia TaxID=292 RepID=UPI00249F53A5|nr:CopG family transcriptional regulator [Burkholderia cepacia]WGY72359.1 CopG family transcriptional regulator [Burkholderia cepacia]
MSRVPVDLSDDQHAALTFIAALKNSSCADVIRDAIDAYVARHATTFADNVFGLWKGRTVTRHEDLQSEW